jgi:hypothetical protein
VNGSEGPDEDIPPAPPLAAVAYGTSVDGKRWTVRAGGSPEQCWTFMYIELPGGRIVGGGGLGGPALPAGRLMNCSFHTEETGVRYVVGRVDPKVARVHLQFSGGDQPRMDLHPAGESAELGVSFVAAILPHSADLAGISAWDAHGNRADQQGTAHYASMLGEGQADRAPGGPPASQGSGWRPLNPGS